MANHGTLLINERPLMILPSLMLRFDGNYTKAAIVQQVHFLSGLPGGVDHLDEHWVWFTYQGLRDDSFPWLSVHTIKKTIASLENDGILVSKNRILNQWDSTKFYRIDYSVLERTLVSA